jgi:hypothetical protein
MEKEFADLRKIEYADQIFRCVIYPYVNLIQPVTSVELTQSTILLFVQGWIWFK